MTNPALQVAGLDGGGTRTRIVIANAEGRTLAHHEFASVNLDDVPYEVARERLTTAVEKVRVASGRQGPFDAAFLGMGGVLARKDQDAVMRLALNANLAPEGRVGVRHDAYAALEGGLLGREGMMIVAGTGSVCFAKREDGSEAFCGNWGPSLGDEGSGHWLGREALRATAHAIDGRKPTTELARATLAWLGIEDDPLELLGRVHDEDLTRSKIASFAPSVLALAKDGDAVAADIVRSGTDALAHAVETAYRRLFASSRVDAFVIGGLTASQIYLEALHEAVQRRVPNVHFVVPKLPPVLGAVRLALRAANVTITDTIDEQLMRERAALPASF